MIERADTPSTTHTEAFATAPENYFIKETQSSFPYRVVCCQYLPASGFVGLGCEDGVLRVYSTSKKEMRYSLVKDDNSPVTCLASTSSASSIKNTIMATHSDGTLEYWHTTSNQLLFQKKYNASLHSCEISNNCEWYAVSAGDGLMLLGHLDKGNPTELETGQLGSHANRVFCIKWHPEDPSIFFSGGWDKAIFMWDVRTRTAVRNLYGYYIAGQSIDVKEDQVLLGNNQNQRHLSIYDLKADKARTLPWQFYDSALAHSTVGVNNCFFGKQPGEILAMTSKNEIRYIKDQKCLSLFKHENPDAKGYSLCHAPDDKVIVASWSNGDVKALMY